MPEQNNDIRVQLATMFTEHNGRLTTVTLSGYACSDMYKDCTFDMSNDGTTLNFDFPTPPVTTIGDYTYSTAYDLAEWMGNTNGFTTP